MKAVRIMSKTCHNRHGINRASSSPTHLRPPSFGSSIRVCALILMATCISVPEQVVAFSAGAVGGQQKPFVDSFGRRMRIKVGTGVTFTTFPALPSSSSTVLFPQRFIPGSGYDPQESSMESAKWSPLEAAEFVFFHVDSPQGTGKQLFPMIQHWTGTELGEFLSRLYLGERKEESRQSSCKHVSNGDSDSQQHRPSSVDVDSKRGKTAVSDITYESKNVRKPQWVGGLHRNLQGLPALLQMLQWALPNSLVMESEEVIRAAEFFLTREHTWPSLEPGESTSGASKATITLETDTFGTQGYASGLATALAAIRKARYDMLARHCQLEPHYAPSFTPHNILAMLSLPEHGSSEAQDMSLKLIEFYAHLDLKWTSQDKVVLVQGMAQRGWKPAAIANFVGSIQLEVIKKRHDSGEDSDTKDYPAVAAVIAKTKKLQTQQKRLQKQYQDRHEESEKRLKQFQLLLHYQNAQHRGIAPASIGSLSNNMMPGHYDELVKQYWKGNESPSAVRSKSGPSKGSNTEPRDSGDNKKDFKDINEAWKNGSFAAWQ